MIQSIEIQGFRGIREGSLAGLTPLVVLVGPNGSGKSTVIEAMLVGASPLTGDALVQVIRRHEAGGSDPRWLLWKAGDYSPSQITVLTATGKQRVCKLELIRGMPASHTRIVYQVLDDGASHGQPSIDAVNRRYVSHGSLGFRPLEDLQEVNLVEGYTTGFQKPLSDVYTMAVHRGKREDVTDIVAKAAPGLTGVEILTENAVPFVYLVYGKDGAVPASLSGDGILSLLRFSLELAASGGGVALLEEPEVHQHPAAIRQTAKVILAAIRRNIQVVLTTHSLELIDALLAEATDGDLKQLSLYRVQLQQGVLKSHRLSSSEVVFARAQIEDDLR